MEVSRRWVEKSGDRCEIRKLGVDTLLFHSEERRPCAKYKVITLCWRLEIDVNNLEELQLELQFKVKVKTSIGLMVSEEIHALPRAGRAQLSWPSMYSW